MYLENVINVRLENLIELQLELRMTEYLENIDLCVGKKLSGWSE